MCLAVGDHAREQRHLCMEGVSDLMPSEESVPLEGCPSVGCQIRSGVKRAICTGG